MTQFVDQTDRRFRMGDFREIFADTGIAIIVTKVSPGGVCERGKRHDC
jgi:hypothetical protein